MIPPVSRLRVGDRTISVVPLGDRIFFGDPIPWVGRREDVEVAVAALAGRTFATELGACTALLAGVVPVPVAEGDEAIALRDAFDALDR